MFCASRTEALINHKHIYVKIDKKCDIYAWCGWFIIDANAQYWFDQQQQQHYSECIPYILKEIQNEPIRSRHANFQWEIALIEWDNDNSNLWDVKERRFFFRNFCNGICVKSFFSYQIATVLTQSYWSLSEGIRMFLRNSFSISRQSNTIQLQQKNKRSSNVSKTKIRRIKIQSFQICTAITLSLYEDVNRSIEWF